MGRRALDQPGPGDAFLGVRDPRLNDVGQGLAGPAEPRVPEGIGRGVGRQVVAVRVDKTLGYDDQAVALALEDAPHVLEDLLLLEGHLGKENHLDD